MDVFTLVLMSWTTAALVLAVIVSVWPRRPDAVPIEREPMTEAEFIGRPAEPEGLDPGTLAPGDVLHVATVSGARYRLSLPAARQEGFDLQVFDAEGKLTRQGRAQIVHHLERGKPMTLWISIPIGNEVFPVITTPVVRVLLVSNAVHAVA